MIFEYVYGKLKEWTIQNLYDNIDEAGSDHKYKMSSMKSSIE